MAKKASLGKGLSALMEEMGQRAEALTEADAAPQQSGPAAASLIPVGLIDPHGGQPRRHFDEAALAELAASIAAHGVLQPILVRPRGARFEIIAGERRWRACQLAGVHEIPAVVRAMDAAAGYEAALIENVQRTDLNPMEEAAAYRTLVDAHGHSVESASRVTGKSRSHVSNLLRLLDLPEDAQALVRMGLLTLGHAKAVLGGMHPGQLAQEVAERGLSVREAEALARASLLDRPAGRAARGHPLDPELAALAGMLEQSTGLRVAIRMKARGGTVSISFSNYDQLDDICRRLQTG